MSARDRILERLRRPDGRPPPVAPDVAGWYAANRTEGSAAERIEQFRAAITAAHAEVHLVDQHWPDLLHEILAAKQVTRLLLAPDTPHGKEAATALRTTGIACLDYAAPVEEWKQELFTTTHAAFTRARSAIAETGTLILWPDTHEPRTMSLVPPIHVVLLDAATIHPNFHAAMTREAWAQGLPTNALLISGPSKTADIQQTLAYGAHGPKELIVLLQGAAP